jgi:hypothetical protein
MADSELNSSVQSNVHADSEIELDSDVEDIESMSDVDIESEPTVKTSAAETVYLEKELDEHEINSIIARVTPRIKKTHHFKLREEDALGLKRALQTIGLEPFEDEMRSHPDIRIYRMGEIKEKRDMKHAIEEGRIHFLLHDKPRSDDSEPPKKYIHLYFFPLRDIRIRDVVVDFFKGLTKSTSHMKSVTPMESPMKSPMKSPMESPMESPMKSPMESPMKSPMESPMKSPMESPMDSPTNSLFETVYESSPTRSVKRSSRKKRHTYRKKTYKRKPRHIHRKTHRKTYYRRKHHKGRKHHTRRKHKQYHTRK